MTFVSATQSLFSIIFFFSQIFSRIILLRWAGSLTSTNNLSKSVTGRVSRVQSDVDSIFSPLLLHFSVTARSHFGTTKPCSIPLVSSTQDTARFRRIKSIIIPVAGLMTPSATTASLYTPPQKSQSFERCPILKCPCVPIAMRDDRLFSSLFIILL